MQVNQRRCYLHRLVMEELHGRPLARSEAVHHRDHNPTNNSPSNLVILPLGDHSRRHNRTKGHTRLVNLCAACGRVFTRPGGAGPHRFAACSPRCVATIANATRWHNPLPFAHA